MAKSRILFIAPLPPPVHGSAMVSQYIKDSKLVNELHDCDFVNLSTSRRMDEIGKGGIRKLLRFIGAYFAVFFKLLTHRYDLCYLAITCHGMGFLKDAPFVLLCKLFRRKVLIHQHNKGMSGCVHRWPYRWLMPLVYRNTRVILLSWHLYDDIAQVVKREQVVICPNGIPLAGYRLQTTDDRQQTRFVPMSENQVRLNSHSECSQSSTTKLLTDCHPEENTTHSTLNAKQELSHADFADYTENASLAGNINLTQTSQNSQNNISEQDNQRASQRAKCKFTCDFSASAASEDVNQQNLDTITQNTHCFARVGHPDGDDAAEQRLIATASQVNAPCAVKGQELTANSQEPSTAQEYSHTEYTESTENASLAENASQQDLNTIAQNGKSLRPCCHPEGNTKHYTLNTKPSAPRLLFLSNLIPSKGVYVLLDACRMLHEQGLSFVCDFVGGETKEIDRATFDAAVKERGLEGIARYQGPKYGEEKERCFAEADIFVFPTFYYNECFPLVLLEAMQYRLPLVSSNEGGIPDIIQHGVNGYTVERKESAPLAEALAQLITHPTLRHDMGTAGYARYQELYTLEAFERQFVSCLVSDEQRSCGL